MEGFSFKFVAHIMILTLWVLEVLFVPAYGQGSTSCTASMVNSFAPCMNFITNGTTTSPTPACCNSLQSLTSASTDCACLILTGNVPFQLPINRTLAVSLPRACNGSSVPLQCKALGAPVAAPAPVSFGTLPPLPSAASPSDGPGASDPVSPTSEPQTPSVRSPSLLPPGTTSPGVRPVVPNSAAIVSTASLPSVLLLVLGATFLNYN
ncbi:hypothetical protein IFM89_013768 [Coptis chinensis]|uniref:Bifunctional inhibitor/plant lipid transfer protein/seed storage helical domain-containing protein n=1 Tax=Coptis chinensis TaxID=261450 RepID=A0A835HXH0_9MAGN|nr:hypothetical protein IFM89_013768 [Coptis chinensis]